MAEVLGLTPKAVEHRLAARPPWVAQGDAHDALQLSVMLSALTGVELSTFPGFGATDELAGAAQRATMAASASRTSRPAPAVEPPRDPVSRDLGSRDPGSAQARRLFGRGAGAAQPTTARPQPVEPSPPAARSEPAESDGGFTREGAITRSGTGAPPPKRLPLSARRERRRPVVEVVAGESDPTPVPDRGHRRLSDLPTLELDWEAAGRTPTPSPRAVTPVDPDSDEIDGPSR